jgi:hypothetical protein
MNPSERGRPVAVQRKDFPIFAVYFKDSELELPMQERRKRGRSHVLKSAKLVLGTSSVVDCSVRNLNGAGARVAVAGTTDLPDNLDLTFDGGRSLRSCRLVWRTLEEVGIEFSECARQWPT